MAPAGMRRSHAKSRLGCHQCKVRRVKCDEQLPACTRCIKRGEKCSFLTNPGEVDSPTSHSNSNGTPHDCSADQHARQLLELELMHHWTTATYKTVTCDRPQNTPMMTIDLPRVALKHEYLLDAIFSFTALHLAYESQPDPHTSDYYVAAAVNFRDRGMQRVAPAMQDFHLIDSNPEDQEVFAMFWFSAYAGMVTLALTVVTKREPSNFASSEPPTGKAFINMLVEIAQLWRGTQAIMDVATALRSAQPYPGVDPHSVSPTPLDPEIDMRLSELAILLEKSTTPSTGSVGDENAPLYRQSVASLRKGFKNFYATKLFDDVMAWGPQLGNDFALLLKAGAPRALLSTMCYGTLLAEVTHVWWAEGAGKALVDECSKALFASPEEWHELIRWARAQVDLPIVVKLDMAGLPNPPGHLSLPGFSSLPGVSDLPEVPSLPQISGLPGVSHLPGVSKDG